MATALTCPECHAEHAVPPGERVATCASCATTSVLVGIDATPQRMVVPRLDRAAAERSARRWLHGLRMRELLAMRATLSAPTLSFLPFVRVQADVLGWLFGIRKHEREKGPPYFTDEEIEIAAAHDDALPLADPGESGVYRLEALAGVETLPFDDTAAAAYGEIVPALTAEQTVEERVRDQWLTAARAGYDLYRVTGEEISLVGLAETVVYYPFWRIGYRYGGGDFYITVDARTGEIAAGKAPGSFFVGAAMFAALLPAASVVLAAGIAAAIALGIAGAGAGDTLGDVLFAAAGAVGIGAVTVGGMLTIAAHRSMRNGGEVESGYGVRPDAGVFADESDGDYRKRVEVERAEVAADASLDL